MSQSRFLLASRLVRGSVLAGTLALLFAGAVQAYGQLGHESDEKAIRAQADDYAKAFATGSADTLAGLWEAQAIFVDQDGNVYRGRDEIKKQYLRFFEHNGGQPLEIGVESIDFPQDNMAIEEGISRLKNSGDSSATARYVATHVKRDGKWLMESVTESPYRAASMQGSLKSLSWLVGNWRADGAKGLVRIKCDWANKNVIAVNVEAQLKNATKSSHSEFIYWNPASRLINSFQFDDSGGISRKWWERQQDQWILHARSIEPDGNLASADYIIKQIDSDSFSYQSKHRELGGVSLPDTDLLKVSREKS